MSHRSDTRRHAAMQRLLHKMESGALSHDEVMRARRFIREQSKQRPPWRADERRRWMLGRRLAWRLSCALERQCGAEVK